MRFYQSVVMLAAAVLVTGLWSGCAPAPRADLVFLNGAEPETLDPALITGQPEGRLANAIFEGLTSFDAAGQPVPGVAKHWQIGLEARVYTFYLRDNARWSNGDPVTAYDFVSSWRRTLDPVTTSEYAYQLYYILNGRVFNEGTLKDFSQVGVKALDAYTLRVELEYPTPFFLNLCAFTTLLPVHVATVECEGDDWIKPGKLVGNGAYQLTAWRINDRIRLKKNPYYWDQANVHMGTIDVIPTSKATTAFNFYASGMADLLLDKGLAPSALLNELKKRDDFHAAPFLGNYFIRFNVTKPPFDDPRVRQAVSLVVNKQTLVDKITRLGEEPAFSLVPPGTAGYQPPAGLDRNPERARALLADAGYPDGAGFPIVYYLYSEGDQNQAIAVEFQAMLKKELGIEIQLSRQEWKVYLNSLSALSYDMARSSWVGDYNDPNTFLDMFVSGGGNNRTGWSNAAYDALIARAAAELDQDKRYAIFHQAEQILISEETPICPLFYYVGIQLYDSDRLGGIEANVLDEHPLKAMFWKDKP